MTALLARVGRFPRLGRGEPLTLGPLAPGSYQIAYGSVERSVGVRPGRRDEIRLEH
jgi:hypothetical protein